MGGRPVHPNRHAAGYHTAEEGQAYRSAVARKLNDAIKVGLLTSGDARHWSGGYSVLTGASSRGLPIVACGKMTQQ
jgi:hypothetical protein